MFIGISTLGESQKAEDDDRRFDDTNVKNRSICGVSGLRGEAETDSQQQEHPSEKADAPEIWGFSTKFMSFHP